MMAHDGLRSACNCCLETLSITVFFDPGYSASQLINPPSAMIRLKSMYDESIVATFNYAKLIERPWFSFVHVL
jgi:hypothetical protein